MNRLALVGQDFDLAPVFADLAHPVDLSRFGGYDEACAELTLFPPDAVVCAPAPGQEEGALDLLCALRTEVEWRVPFVLVCPEDAEAETMVAAFASGADEVVCAPLAPAELRTKIERLLCEGRNPRSGSYLQNLPHEEGMAFGRFMIERVLAGEGSATLFSAYDVYSGAPVALKVLEPARPTDDPWAQSIRQQRLLREAYALAGLDHPALPQVFDHGVVSGRSYLALELVEGPTLAEHVQLRGPCSSSELRTLARILAECLDQLARADLVHRNLRPESVILRGSTLEGLCLADFGITRHVGDLSLTPAGDVLGDPRFMAPEVLRGEPATHRSDLYSLGLVLLYAATAARPFAELQGLQLLERAAGGPPELPTGLDRSVELILDWVLAAEATARPRHAKDALALLERRSTRWLRRGARRLNTLLDDALTSPRRLPSEEVGLS
ncbi:MAG TPA: hypothetical protein DEA08_15290 [Planctomycetes bacterium]|nr:hypothetical protein [Planctomycetota bacterium]